MKYLVLKKSSESDRLANSTISTKRWPRKLSEGDLEVCIVDGKMLVGGSTRETDIRGDREILETDQQRKVSQLKRAN